MNRLLSLDVFRGIAIVLMVLVNNPGSWQTIYWPLRHAEWHGLTPTDLVFPFFIFAMGASIALSQPESVNKSGLILKVLRRSVLLFACGLFLALFFYNPYQAEYNWLSDRVSQLRVMGVLQRLALVYLFTALLVMFVSKVRLIYWCLGLLLLYWLMMTYIPYSGEGEEIYQGLWQSGNSFSAWLDHTLLGPQYVYYGNAAPFTFDPEGLLGTMPAVSTCLFGVLAGHWLRQTRAVATEPYGLLASGVATLLLGLVAVLWNPVNKALWSPSFVLITAGLAMILLVLLHILTGKENWQGWTKPFVIAGTNSLFFFVFSGFAARLLFMIPVGGIPLKSALYQQYFLPLATPYNASLLFAFTFLLLMFVPTALLYRKGCFIRL